MDDSFYLIFEVEALLPSGGLDPEIGWKGGENMNAPQLITTMFPDEKTLQAWEDMRIEVLHELQEGASADVPDTLIDTIGNLVVILNSWRDKTRIRPRLHQEQIDHPDERHIVI